jgi:hypothetical protein
MLTAIDPGVFGLANRSLENTQPEAPPPANPYAAAAHAPAAGGGMATLPGEGPPLGMDTVLEAQAPAVVELVVQQPAPRWILWGWIGVGVLTMVLIAVLVALFRN